MSRMGHDSDVGAFTDAIARALSGRHDLWPIIAAVSRRSQNGYEVWITSKSKRILCKFTIDGDLISEDSEIAREIRNSGMLDAILLAGRTVRENVGMANVQVPSPTTHQIAAALRQRDHAEG